MYEKYVKFGRNFSSDKSEAVSDGQSFGFGTYSPRKNLQIALTHSGVMYVSKIQLKYNVEIVLKDFGALSFS